MRVAIVGSRDFPDEGRVRLFVRRLATKYPGAVVVSGAARGVDSWAASEARRCGLSVLEFPADWQRHGRSAGFKRNRDIVEAADRVVAFWDGSSRGTAHSVGLARDLGKPVHIFEP